MSNLRRLFVKSQRGLSFISKIMSSDSKNEFVSKDTKNSLLTSKTVLDGKAHAQTQRLSVSTLEKVESLTRASAQTVAKQIISEGLKSSLAISEVGQTGKQREKGSKEDHPVCMDEAEASEEHSASSLNRQDSSEGDEESQDVRKQSKKGKKKREKDKKNVKVRPNHFVAVQVTNPEIHEVAKKIQAEIQESFGLDLDVSPAFIKAEKLHLTLMVMHLPGEEDIQRAGESLEKCIPAIRERLNGLEVTLYFEGVSTFNGGKVLIAVPKPSDGLDHLHFIADEVSRQMGENRIMSTDKRPFNPHMTLMKFQGEPKLLRQGIKKLEPSHYLPFVDEVLGEQTVLSMQLCSMTEKREDGYYAVPHEVYF